MKKIALTLAALAALATVTTASQAMKRSYDIQEWKSYNSSSGVAPGTAVAGKTVSKKLRSFGLAVTGGSGMTAFERQQMLSEQNTRGRH